MLNGFLRPSSFPFQKIKILQEKYQSSLKDIIDTIVNTLMQAEQDRRDDITCLGINIKPL